MERAAERESKRAFRELQRQQIALEKAEEQERNANEVALFDGYLTLLVSVHKEQGEPWNWSALVTAPAPALPTRSSHREKAAKAELHGYRPGLFDKVFGKAAKERTRLQQLIVEARAEDSKAYALAVETHECDREIWDLRRAIARRVLAREGEGYQQAITHAVPFEELETHGLAVSLTTIDTDAVVVYCELTDGDVVPTEEKKLTAGGKVATKQMPASRYWSLYQDFVCSSAIRVARETLAVLPIARAIVNVGTSRVDTSTGHPGLVTLLSASFSRDAIEHLNLDRIDPSDAMKNFPHQMDFKKTTGFDAVEPIRLEDGWVTTG